MYIVIRHAYPMNLPAFHCLVQIYTFFLILLVLLRYICRARPNAAPLMAKRCSIDGETQRRCVTIALRPP